MNLSGLINFFIHSGNFKMLLAQNLKLQIFIRFCSFKKAQTFEPIFKAQKYAFDDSAYHF